MVLYKWHHAYNIHTSGYLDSLPEKMQFIIMREILKHSKKSPWICLRGKNPWKFCNNQAYRCPRGQRFSASWGQIEGPMEIPPRLQQYFSERFEESSQLGPHSAWEWGFNENNFRLAVIHLHVFIFLSSLYFFGSETIKKYIYRIDTMISSTWSFTWLIVAGIFFCWFNLW